MSLDDVARVTKIQPRILERLEAGTLDGLPAEVFVRGFVRSVAKCVGLCEDEALRRFLACGQQAAIPPAARAMVEAMGELAPVAARVAPRTQPRSTAELPVVQPELAAGSLERMPIAQLCERPIAAPPAVAEAVIEPPVQAQAPVPVQVIEEAKPPIADDKDARGGGAGTKKKRTRRAGKGRGKRGQLAVGTPSEPSPIVREEAAIAEAASAEPAASASSSTVNDAPVEPAAAPIAAATAVEPDAAVAPLVDPPAPSRSDDDEPIATATWQPQMPPLASTATPPWKVSRAGSIGGPPAPVTPSLIIDDADPESAERELEERAAGSHEAGHDLSHGRRSFLPPILLDREDRSARQGGLTLAVIILLIAATLTLSYLMRRPSSSVGGVTERSAPATLIG